MGVFKTYDIRGIYGQEIDEELAYKVGRAFARFLNKDSYLIGHDARLHSPALYRAAAQGLADEGCRVKGIGLASTPQLHFFQMREDYEGGVMVTASHNPPEYHGFKLYDDRGGSVSYDKGLDRIEAIVAGLGREPPRPGGQFDEGERIDAYIDFIQEVAGRDKLPRKVVVDVGNGSAGRVFRRLAERLGLDAVILNEEPDGRFPNRNPNPLKPEARLPAAAALRKAKADLAALVDGDGDRVVFLDERGEAVENYFIAALIAEELLTHRPGAAVVYDLISSRALPERIRELGGKPVVSRVGYTFLYEAMVAEGALFGAETSGHVYFRVTDRFYTESAAYALVVLLRLLVKRGKPLSELVAPLARRYVQSEEINIEIHGKDEVMARVEKHYEQAGARLERLDGISVQFDDCWFNVRPSNTEPLLRLRLEAVDREALERRTAELKGFLQSAVQGES
jgi:phosphomannomutase